MHDLTGKSLGRYHILEILGRGGMAVIYKAYDTRLERNVAIKVIRREVFGEEVLERILQRFEREAKALARLDHTHIVKVYDYGEFEGSPYLVMQYVQGGTLRDQTGRAVPWQDTFRMLIPIARALAYSHEQGILHRDVKPSNMLINPAGELLLSDFGIAKILEGESGGTITGTGVGIGTPEYMAPEQGMGSAVDGRADVYALGIVLYELITGQKPYEADTPLAVLFKQMNDPLPRPQALVPHLPESVEKVLLKALAKKPEDRYPSMNMFAAAMERLLTTGTAITEKETETTDFTFDQPPGLAHKILPQTKSGGTAARFLVPGIVVLAVLLLGGFAILTMLPGITAPPLSPTTPTTSEITAAEPAPTLTALPTLTRTAKPSPTMLPSKTPLPAVVLSGDWAVTLNVEEIEYGKDYNDYPCPELKTVNHSIHLEQRNDGMVTGYTFGSKYGYLSATEYQMAGRVKNGQFEFVSTGEGTTCTGVSILWKGSFVAGKIEGSKSISEPGANTCCFYVGSFSAEKVKP